MGQSYSTSGATGSVLTPREQREVERANAGQGAPIVFVHGLWLLPSSWERWRRLFEARGYLAIAPSWPDDPETVEEARRHPELFADKRLLQVTEHIADVIRLLKKPPAIVGHSFGGLIAQKLAGMGLSMATVAIDPAPFRGVLPLPFSTIKSAFPVLGNPANYHRGVPLTFEQFRYAFANAVSEEEARELYDEYAVAASGVAVFQSATANLHPGTEAKVDTKNPERGPLLFIAGEQDHIVPWAISNAAYKRQKRNVAPTEIRGLPTRCHSLTIDSGWEEVAEIALAFVKSHYPPETVIRPGRRVWGPAPRAEIRA